MWYLSEHTPRAEAPREEDGAPEGPPRHLWFPHTVAELPHPEGSQRPGSLWILLGRNDWGFNLFLSRSGRFINTWLQYRGKHENLKLKTVIVKDHEEAIFIQYVCDILYLIGLLYSFRIRVVKLTLLLAYEFFMSFFPVNVF